MTSRKKKIFIIVLVLAGFSLFFFGIYNFAFKEKKLKSQSKKEQTKNEKTIEKKKEVKNGKISVVTDEAVLSPVITPDGFHIRYYVKESGHVFEILLNGSGKNNISNRNLPDLIGILWSPERDKVIATYNKNGRIENHLFDYNTKIDKVLDPNIDNIAWSNLGDKIIYKYTNPHSNKRYLSVADPDGKNWKNLSEIYWSNVKIAPVPKSAFVSFWNTPNSNEIASLNLVSIAGGEVKNIFNRRYGGDFLWSPNGTRVLISSSETKENSKVVLSSINNNGGEYLIYNIPTLVSKCVWSKDNETVYYALPISIPEGAVMPNDYLDGKIRTKDTFWKFNVLKGKQERLVELSEITESFDASNLFLSDDEKKLYFINRYDNRLYLINL